MPELRPGPLPTYEWASSDAGHVPLTGWEVALAPVAAVEPESFTAAPPPHPGRLVPLGHPRIRLLSAYWHEGWPHAHSTTWLRPDAASRLYEAVDLLPPGFGLAVWDAWRDPELQKVLHDTVYQNDDLAPGFVAYPDPDPAHCPPHATGGTVDLTLTWANEPLSLGTTFDAFVPGAAAAALEPDGPEPQRQLRRLLAAAMGGAGFVVHPQEWWHWEYGTRMWAAVTGAPVVFGHTHPDPKSTR